MIRLIMVFLIRSTKYPWYFKSKLLKENNLIPGTHTYFLERKWELFVSFTDVSNFWSQVQQKHFSCVENFWSKTVKRVVTIPNSYMSKKSWHLGVCLAKSCLMHVQISRFGNRRVLFQIIKLGDEDAKMEKRWPKISLSV